MPCSLSLPSANTQEEMIIRAMTCHGRRRRRDRENAGGDEPRAYFAPIGGHRTITAAGSRSPPPPAGSKSTAPRTASTSQGDKENAHPSRRRNSSTSAMARPTDSTHSPAAAAAAAVVAAGAAGADPFTSDGSLALSGSLANRTGSWGASPVVNGLGESSGGRSVLESRGGDRCYIEPNTKKDWAWYSSENNLFVENSFWGEGGTRSIHHWCLRYFEVYRSSFRMLRLSCKAQYSRAITR